MKLPFLLFLALASSSLLLAEQTFVSKAERVDLIELFTSEGCSSCPPAERRLNDYAEHKGLWTDFVPVAFHVDYWNYLGWHDRFSSPDFSARQRCYSKEWQARTVFTPCFVVNGSVESRPWKKNHSNQPGILALRIDETVATVTFTPTVPSGQEFTAWLAPLCGTETTRVQSGENCGRKLQHNFVALRLTSESMTATSGVYSVTLSFPRHPEVKAAAVWITESHSLKPIQATGGWLE